MFFRVFFVLFLPFQTISLHASEWSPVWTHCLISNKDPFFVYLRTTPAIWSGPSCLLVTRFPNDPEGVYHVIRDPKHPNRVPILELKDIKKYASFWEKFLSHYVKYVARWALYLTTENTLNRFGINLMTTFTQAHILQGRPFSLPIALLYDLVEGAVQGLSSISHTSKMMQDTISVDMDLGELKLGAYYSVARVLLQAFDVFNQFATDFYGDLFIVKGNILPVDHNLIPTSKIRWQPDSFISTFQFSEMKTIVFDELYESE